MEKMMTKEECTELALEQGLKMSFTIKKGYNGYRIVEDGKEEERMIYPNSASAQQTIIDYFEKKLINRANEIDYKNSELQSIDD